MVRSVRVDGLRDLERVLTRDLPKAAAKGVLRRVGLKALAPVAETASGMAPNDPATGAPDLSTSIGVGAKLSDRQARMQKRAEGKSAVEVYAGVSPDAGQGILQEFGTAHHAAQPFLRPAWDAQQDAVLASVARDLGVEIEKAVARRARRLAKGTARK